MTQQIQKLCPMKLVKAPEPSALLGAPGTGVPTASNRWCEGERCMWMMSSTDQKTGKVISANCAITMGVVVLAEMRQLMALEIAQGQAEEAMPPPGYEDKNPTVK